MTLQQFSFFNPYEKYEKVQVNALDVNTIFSILNNFLIQIFMKLQIIPNYILNLIFNK